MEQQKETPGEPRGLEPAAPACPQCGTPLAVDGTPACACGPRASEALRDARTAQAAAAEDFDPLRIRPYVELDDAGEPSAPDTPSGSGPSDPEATMTFAAVPAEPAPDAPMALRAVGAQPQPSLDATTALPTPLAPSADAPHAHDLRMFDPAAPADPGEPPRPHRRRRKGVLLSAAGAVVVIVGVAGFAGGLFSYESPSRDDALPDEVRASVPDPSPSEETTPAPGASAPSAPSASAAPSASPSASASAEASPSASPPPSASGASPTPSASTDPTPTTSTTAPSDDTPPQPDQGGIAPAPDTTLHPGDQGPAVVELQQRLSQLYLFTRTPNGSYDQHLEQSVRTYQWARGIRSDELGVYGPETRRKLESETHRP